MENLFTHFDLTEFPQIDRKEEIIETQKKVKKINARLPAFTRFRLSASMRLGNEGAKPEKTKAKRYFFCT